MTQSTIPNKEQIENMVDSFKKTKEEFTSKMKTEFNAFFKEFFRMNPDISQVKWNQYTVYFNDGDECKFSTRFYDILDLDSSMPKDDYERLQKIETELEKVLESIPDDIYKDMFGDHVSIIATVEGFDIDSYEDHE